MRRSGRLAGLILCLSAVCFPCRVGAQESPQEASETGDSSPNGISPELRERARESFSRGQELFRESKFVEAETAFLEAYRIIPNPVVLLGVARARQQNGDIAGSVEMLQRYFMERAEPAGSDREADQVLDRLEADLEANPNTPSGEELETRVGLLKRRNGLLVVQTTPEGAAVIVDGVPTGRVSPVDLEVREGHHVVELRLDGHEAIGAEIEARAGGRHEVTGDLPALPPPPDAMLGAGEPVEEPEPLTDEEIAPPEREANTAVWVSTGIAAGALVTGTVLGFLALSEENDFNTSPDADTADKGERFALFADVAFGIAGAAAVTALVLYLTSDADAASEDTAAGSIDVAPVVGVRSGGVSARVQF